MSSSAASRSAQPSISRSNPQPRYSADHYSSCLQTAIQGRLWEDALKIFNLFLRAQWPTWDEKTKRYYNKDNSRKLSKEEYDDSFVRFRDHIEKKKKETPAVQKKQSKAFASETADFSDNGRRTDKLPHSIQSPSVDLGHQTASQDDAMSAETTGSKPDAVEVEELPAVVPSTPEDDVASQDIDHTSVHIQNIDVQDSKPLQEDDGLPSDGSSHPGDAWPTVPLADPLTTTTVVEDSREPWAPSDAGSQQETSKEDLADSPVAALEAVLLQNNPTALSDETPSQTVDGVSSDSGVGVETEHLPSVALSVENLGTSTTPMENQGVHADADAVGDGVDGADATEAISVDSLAFNECNSSLMVATPTATPFVATAVGTAQLPQAFVQGQPSLPSRQAIDSLMALTYESRKITMEKFGLFSKQYRIVLKDPCTNAPFLVMKTQSGQYVRAYQDGKPATARLSYRECCLLYSDLYPSATIALPKLLETFRQQKRASSK